MAVDKKRSWQGTALFIILQGIIIFFLAEAILSIVYYQKYGNDSLAIVQFYKKIKIVVGGNEDNTYDDNNQRLIRPDSPQAMNKAIAAEVKESNITVYEPWLQFKNADFSGKYVNIDGPLRKSIPDAFYTESADTVTIFFFGGSTLFGFNVTDRETIPSQFVQLYQQQFPKGKSIRIYNFAMPFYYSYQELVLMSHLFFNGNRPNLLVFLDGLNDFRFVKASYYHQPFFSYILREVFNKEYLKQNRFHFKDTSAAMTEMPRGMTQSAVADTLQRFYFENINNASKIATLYNAKTFFFCQPVPFYHYPGQDKDPLCDKDKHTIFDFAYPAVEKRGAAVKNFTFLGNMLQKEGGYPFVDGFHYSPGMNKKIATAILSGLQSELQ